MAAGVINAEHARKHVFSKMQITKALALHGGAWPTTRDIKLNCVVMKNYFYWPPVIKTPLATPHSERIGLIFCAPNHRSIKDLSKQLPAKTSRAASRKQRRLAKYRKHCDQSTKSKRTRSQGNPKLKLCRCRHACAMHDFLELCFFLNVTFWW